MSKKTGKAATRAKQQMRSAKVARYKKELKDAGVNLKLPKPSKKDMKAKEEELKKLYLEMFPGKSGEVESEGTDEKSEGLPEEQEMVTEKSETEEKSKEEQTELPPEQEEPAKQEEVKKTGEQKKQEKSEQEPTEASEDEQQSKSE